MLYGSAQNAFFSLEWNRRSYIDFIIERVSPTRINMRYRLETTKPTVHISFEGLFFLLACVSISFFISYQLLALVGYISHLESGSR
jgi:hypothetical protein